MSQVRVPLTSQHAGTKVDIDRKIEAAFAKIQRKLVRIPRVRAPLRWCCRALACPDRAVACRSN